MRLVLLAFLLLATIVSAFPPAAGGQTSVDEAMAAQVAVELSYLESIGDFNALYDRIHPDAHAIIPRSAVIGWYQNEFAPRGPGVATVTGIRFVSWTWPVNGYTYGYTAEVSFVQPFADGTVLEDVVRLVQDVSGEWRWFFGRSREFVEEQIARYSQQTPARGSSVSILDFVASDLNGFWGIAFGAAGGRYVPPSMALFVPNSSSGCGYMGRTIGPAAYCGLDMTVYVDVAWFATLDAAIGDFAWITIMAHEWGHHLQYLGGVSLPRKQLELQADCLAGAYARDAETRGLLDPGDVVEAVSISAQSGDRYWLPDDAEGAHGSGDERVAAFMRGFLDGFIGCGFLSFGAPPVPAAPAAPAQTALASILPLQAEVPSGLSPVGDSYRTLRDVAVNYTDPAETERLFRGWGWEENVTRTFEGSSPSGVTLVYVSIHRFGDAQGAANGLHHSVADQMASTGAWEIAVAPLGQTTRAMATAGDVTIYAQQGDVLIRLTVAGASSTHLPAAEAIVASMLARA